MKTIFNLVGQLQANCLSLVESQLNPSLYGFGFIFFCHFSDAVAIEKVTVDDEFMDSDDSSIEQPLEKKAKGAPIPTSSMGGEIASSVNPFVCMAIGCPAINKDFKTKDNYGKHLK